MKKGDAKTFVLLGIFMFIGLLFMLFAKINPENMPYLGAAEAKKQEQTPSKANEPKTPEELSEKMFSDKMGEFKNAIIGLEQKDLQKFKTDSNRAFNKLADLLGEFSSLTGDNQSKINENILGIRRSAEKVALLQDEQKVINEIKNGFTTANDTLKDIKANLNCEKPEDRTLCDSISRKNTDIETKVGKIDKTNYMLRTKELFADFHSILRSMHKEIYAPANMTMIQPEDAQAMSEQPYQEINKKDEINYNDDDKNDKDKNNNNDNDKSKKQDTNENLNDKSKTTEVPKCPCKKK